MEERVRRHRLTIQLLQVVAVDFGEANARRRWLGWRKKANSLARRIRLRIAASAAEGSTGGAQFLGRMLPPPDTMVREADHTGQATVNSCPNRLPAFCACCHRVGLKLVRMVELIKASVALLREPYRRPLDCRTAP
jgi:hypothetical protein